MRTAPTDPLGAGPLGTPVTWWPSGVLLSVPGSRPDRFDGAARSGCDGLVLDLEDSVLPEERAAARDAVADWLKTRAGDLPVVVRINRVGSAWHAADVEAVAASRPAAVMVPKVDSEQDVMAVVDRLREHAAAEVGVVALVETARGCLALRGIARSHGLVAMTLGYGDLAADTGRAATADWGPVRLELLLAARAHGIAAVDGPELHIRDDDDFERTVREQSSGFDAKWVLHPRQVEAARRGLTAPPQVIDEARRVVAALAEAARSGSGVARLDGRMLDEAVGAEARRVLLRAGVE